MKYPEEYLSELFICSVVDKKNTKASIHCTNHCGHARFHKKDSCSGEEFCNLHESEEIIKVKCRRIKKKELKELLNKQQKGESIDKWILDYWN